MTGSNKSFPFCIEGITKKLNIFESPIDLMSYMSLCELHNKKYINHGISLGGLSYKGVDRYLKEKIIEEIILCVDNDKAGDDYVNKFNEKYKNKYKIKRHKPQKKDFNEDLEYFKRNDMALER